MDEKYEVICADVIDWASTYDGPKFHAILCDPPYDYAFMGKKWDDAIAMQPDTWQALTTHLHPGAFIVAFSGARTYHRLACALEDAGLIIHSMIGWLYGSGFPKSTRIKNSPEFEGHRYGLQALKPALEPIAVAQKPYEGKPVHSITSTGAGALNIDAARVETTDRLTAGGTMRPNSGDERTGPALGMFQENTPNTFSQNPSGRWPPNFALSHHPDCIQTGTKQVASSTGGGKGFTPATMEEVGYADGLESVPEYQCVEGCPVLALNQQAGTRSSGKMQPNQQRKSSKGLGGYHDGFPDTATVQGTYGDTGSASRFFPNFDYALERIESANPFLYCPKASRKERDAGLNEMDLCDVPYVTIEQTTKIPKTL